jgi:hypothetical protein
MMSTTIPGITSVRPSGKANEIAASTSPSFHVGW